MDIIEIGNRIKQARNMRNYTLDAIADEIGVAKSTIQRYENGLINKPKLPVLQAIADSLKVSPAWIAGQDVPMDAELSLNDILQQRLCETGISLNELATKSNVPLYWLEHIDSFIPGQLGDYEIGYDWITRVANVLNLPAGILRAALAKQEIPANDNPPISAEIAFGKQEPIYFAISTEESNHLYKFRAIDEHGRELVNTVLDKEYERCTDASNNVIKLVQDKSYLAADAAHDRTDISPEERTVELTQQEDDIMNDDNF